MADALNVSAAVQAVYGSAPLSWWTVHKLLYYCQGWNLAWTGLPLFSGRIEAWKNGPVVTQVYRVQKYYTQEPPGSAAALTGLESKTVKSVVSFYGRYSAAQLVALTHREAPWRAARVGIPAGATCKNEVRRETMREYFSSLGVAAHDLRDGLRRTIDVLLATPEDMVDRMLEDSGVDFDAELAYLRGQGPDPWPPTTRCTVSQPFELDLIQPPTKPQGSEADLAAQRTWQETGYVPMEYVQEHLRHSFSSGQTVEELVRRSIEAHCHNKAT